ncbi:hypothetical protein F4803DRAFT_556285 [Xylaria telfairii]|nr:hypothetical protein F4803DRAFT_556285 [Xylaria telfairii]
MKTSVVLGAISAGLVAAELLSPPENFPACGTTCFGNMLGQASQLGCGSGGSTQDAVDGACLCKNINFSYGIIDCANAACPQGEAPTVIQYGLNWCAEKGVVVGGLSATPDPSIASSATTTISATSGSGDSGSNSGTSATSTPVTDTTGTSSSVEGSVTTVMGTTSPSDGSAGPSPTGGVVIPIGTTEIIATSTNSAGDVVTTTLATSTIFSTSDAANGSGTGSASATDSGSASDSTAPEPTPTEGNGVVTTASSTEGATPTTTTSNGGSFQTAAPKRLKLLVLSRTIELLQPV